MSENKIIKIKVLHIGTLLKFRNPGTKFIANLCKNIFLLQTKNTYCKVVVCLSLLPGVIYENINFYFDALS